MLLSDLQMLSSVRDRAKLSVESVGYDGNSSVGSPSPALL